jgi:hypothetical protein
MTFRENRIEKEKQDLLCKLKFEKNNLDILSDKLKSVKNDCERNTTNEEMYCVKNQIIMSIRNTKYKIFDLEEALSSYSA